MHRVGIRSRPNRIQSLKSYLNAAISLRLIADTYHMFKPTMNFSRGFAHFDFIRGQESDNWQSGDPKLIEAQLREARP